MKNRYDGRENVDAGLGIVRTSKGPVSVRNGGYCDDEEIMEK